METDKLLAFTADILRSTSLEDGLQDGRWGGVQRGAATAGDKASS